MIKDILDRFFVYEKVNLLLKNRYLPRWVIFTFDIFVVLSAFVLSYNLRYNFSSAGLNTLDEFRQMIILITAYLTGFIMFKPFAGIIRHTTSHDIQKIFLAVLFSSAMLVAITLLSRTMFHSRFLIIPLSVIIIHMMVTATLLTLSRIIIKYVFHFISRLKLEMVPVMIYGAGDLGQATLLALEKSVSPSYEVVGFIDSNKGLQGKNKSGKTIYSPSASIKKIIPVNKIKIIIVAIRPGSLKKEAEEKMLAYCLENKIELRKIPPIKEWLNGGFEARQLKRIAIDDLLGREEIKLNTGRIQQGLEGKTILVTGAAGSIGSEIVRQLISYKTGKIILLDQAESALYDLQMELRARYNGGCDFDVVIADISNYQRLKNVFELYRPGIVFNAAAYKHVPLLEDNVCGRYVIAIRR
jgi:FlaA1/EpsC-like NDP-sugar epimerase